MTSRLFQLANSAARLLTGEGPRQALRSQAATRQLARVAEAALHPQPERYEQGAGSAIRDLINSLGPIGNAIQAVLGGPQALRGRGGLDEAIALIRALGADVLVRDPQSPHYQRGLRAARELLEEAERLPSRMPTTIPAPPGRGPPPKTPAPPADDWPEEGDIQLLGRGAPYYEPDWEKLSEREIFTPDSSNVYSFVYEPETDHAGILYVTFKRGLPGHKGPRPNLPGPTYAYYDVPERKYRSFKQRSKTTAGGAVWDFLRVRGSQYDHRHPYRLIAGTNIPLGGVYVPRKATKRGFRKRALPRMGIGPRGYHRSTLPEQVRPDTGRPRPRSPGRAAPNRGR